MVLSVVDIELVQLWWNSRNSYTAKVDGTIHRQLSAVINTIFWWSGFLPPKSISRLNVDPYRTSNMMTSCLSHCMKAQHYQPFMRGTPLRPVKLNFHIIFGVSSKQLLNKQFSGRLFETPWLSLTSLWWIPCWALKGHASYHVYTNVLCWYNYEYFNTHTPRRKGLLNWSNVVQNYMFCVNWNLISLTNIFHTCPKLMVSIWISSCILYAF